MITTTQLAADLQSVHSGNSWLGYSALEILQDITPQMAMTKCYGEGNSIWQIVNHISFWREQVTKRIIEKRTIDTDETGHDNPPVADQHEWDNTLHRFNQSFDYLHTAITQFNSDSLFEEVGEHGSYYYNITGCIQHDAFHLGQVMILKRKAQKEALTPDSILAYESILKHNL